ncbi:MAG: serine/threonine-protein kinase, partial [Kofleriaceae bacterium]
MSVQDQVAKSLKLVGRVLGDKFKLTACIGIGGSGAVYKADQIALGRTVAVKILNEELSADTRMISRFRGEAMSASRLNHPNCVSIIDYGQAPDGLLYLAMEYVKGPTLTQLLVNENPLDVDRVLDIIAQTLHGIEEAHGAGVVHADLKADNIILDQRRAGTDMVKIVDFGIARLVTGVRDVNEDRSISGTPEYMSPEVISGAPPSFASDIYALGIILYELLAERTPFFAGSTTEILTNHLKAQPQLLTLRRENIPPQVDSVMTKALAKHPTDRYTTAAEMRDAVNAIRAQMRNLPAIDKCVSCGTSCQPQWKYCPECATARA